MPQQLENMDLNLPDYTDVLQETQQVLNQCFKQFTLEEVFLSFNGGKDCTALLDIAIDVLKHKYNSEDIARQLKIVYIRTDGPFHEIEEFVKKIESHYEVKLEVMEGDLKHTLEIILEQDTRLKACLMGTRRTDPYSKDLGFMQKTDPGWPQVFRVSPLLNWSYHQIWSYILQRKVPYCTLYDIGYTSIGSKHNTLPNPSLKYSDSSGEIHYRAAWFLNDGSLERAGRVKRTNETSNGNVQERIHNGDSNCHVCTEDSVDRCKCEGTLTWENKKT